MILAHELDFGGKTGKGSFSGGWFLHMGLGVGWLVEWRRWDMDVGKVQERRRGHGGGKSGKVEMVMVLTDV